MGNIIFGLQNVWVNVVASFKILLSSGAFWGFCIGFGVSTIIHVIVISGGVRNASHVLTKSADKSYKVVVPSDKNHPEYKTLEQFRAIHRRTHLIGFIGLIAILLVIFYLVLR